MYVKQMVRMNHRKVIRYGMRYGNGYDNIKHIPQTLNKHKHKRKTHHISNRPGDTESSNNILAGNSQLGLRRSTTWFFRAHDGSSATLRRILSIRDHMRSLWKFQLTAPFFHDLL